MATELTLEFAGLRVILTVAGTDEAWGLVRRLSELRNGPDGQLSSSLYKDEESGRAVTPSQDGAKSQAEQIRELVRPILADGRGHERRELTKVVRDAGLKVANLDSALKGHFYRFENGHGRPAYRDRSAPEPWGDTEKPDWFQPPPPSSRKQPIGMKGQVQRVNVNGGRGG